MSQTEFKIGKVKEVAKEQKTLKEKILFVMNEKKLSFKEFGVTEDELNEDERPYIDNEEFFIANGRLFEVLENKDLDEDEDICEVENIGEDVYTYKLKYYNGGTSFDEMFEEGLDNIE